MNRVILNPAPCTHLFHAMEVVRDRVGATYEQCLRCETRRVVVGSSCRSYDTHWLLTGEFADPELRLIHGSGMAAREERMAA